MGWVGWRLWWEGFLEKMVFSLKWKTVGVMVGYSGADGKDKLTCLG